MCKILLLNCVLVVVDFVLGILELCSGKTAMALLLFLLGLLLLGVSFGLYRADKRIQRLRQER